MKKLLLVAVMALIVSPVLAVPTLPDGADAYWAINDATGQADAKIIFENSSPGDVFGLFDKTNTATKLVVFQSTDGVNNTAVVTILGPVSGGIGLSTLDTDHPAIVDNETFAANAFGYYLTTPGGNTFYSDTLLNPSQIDHMTAGVLISGSEYTLTWSGNERNYFVANVESVHPIVPAPGAILLGSIGVSLVGWLRRRRTL